MRTSVRQAVFWVVFTLTLGLAACGQAPDFALSEYAPKSSSASIKAVSLGTSDSNNFDSKRVATQFPAGTKKVLVWYRWEGADKDSKVAIHWTMDGAPVLQQGEALGKESGSAAWILEVGAGGDLPPAAYKVELLENDALVTAIPFQVGSPGAAPPVALVQVPATATSPSPTPADVPAPVAESSAAMAQAAAPSALAALASADGERSGARVEVIELKRSSGDTVSLKFALINDAGEKFGFTGYYLGDSAVSSDYSSVGGVHLVDPAGKKKYLVVRDSGSKCVCSTEMANLEPKTRTNLWAKFPAPPVETQKVSIVIPHFSPMDDVPISQ